MKSIILLLIVTILYSGMLYGVLPTQPGVSWESHLYGGLVGILVSYILRGFDIKEHDDIELVEHKPISEGDKEYYFNRDLFDKRLSEREEELRSRD